MFQQQRGRILARVGLRSREPSSGCAAGAQRHRGTPVMSPLSSSCVPGAAAALREGMEHFFLKQAVSLGTGRFQLEAMEPGTLLQGALSWCLQQEENPRPRAVTRLHPSSHPPKARPQTATRGHKGATWVKKKQSCSKPDVCEASPSGLRGPVLVSIESHGAGC